MVRWLIRVVHDGIFDGTIFWHIRELWNNASVAKVILTLVALFAKVQMSNSTANRSSRTQGTKKLVKLEIHFVETDHRCSECHEWKPFPPRYFQYSRECVYIDNIKEKVSSSKNQDRKQTHVRLNDATRTNYSRWISKKFIFSKKKKTPPPPAPQPARSNRNISLSRRTLISQKKSLIDSTRYPSKETRTVTFLNRHISQRI